MKKSIIKFIILFPFLIFSQQKPIDIAELTIKLVFQETKELFYCFAEGDEIIFDFKMVKGKHLKEIEIIELPSNSVFMEFKAKKINRKVKIRKKGLYKFKFYSSSLTNRVCKIKINRIPLSEETKDFNTNWKWKILRDTIYTPYIKDSIVGYRTVHFQETKKELIKTEIKEELVFTKNQRVNSNLNSNGNLAYLRVDLPKPKITYLLEKKVIAWAYWIGVGKEGQQAYVENSNAIKDLAVNITSAFGTPLAALAVGTITDLIIPKSGQDVGYYFISDFYNVQKFLNNQVFFQFDQGKGRAAFGKKSNRNKGTFFIGLSNDNNVTPIDVDVKIVVIKEIKTYEDKIYNKQREEPIYVALNKTRMFVKETKIRVSVE